MSQVSYSSASTGLLLVDPYNDFLAEGGKLQGRAKEVLEQTDTIAHMRQMVQACRAADIRVFYVPHNRSRPSDFSLWANPTPYQLGGHRIQLFAEGSWGAQWHPDFQPKPEDVMVKEQGAEPGVDTVEVGDVVAVVTIRRGVERHEPQDADPEAGEVVDALGQSGEVAGAVAVPVEEGLDVEAVDHGALPPLVARDLDAHDWPEPASSGRTLAA